MFTGIIEGLGNVQRLTAKGADAVIEIEAAIDLKDVAIGDSIAVNGACLTVITKKEKTFSADVSAETIAKTTLGFLHAGDKICLLYTSPSPRDS